MWNMCLSALKWHGQDIKLKFEAQSRVHTDKTTGQMITTYPKLSWMHLRVGRRTTNWSVSSFKAMSNYHESAHEVKKLLVMFDDVDKFGPSRVRKILEEEPDYKKYVWVQCHGAKPLDRLRLLKDMGEPDTVWLRDYEPVKVARAAARANKTYTARVFERGHSHRSYDWKNITRGQTGVYIRTKGYEFLVNDKEIDTYNVANLLGWSKSLKLIDEDVYIITKNNEGVVKDNPNWTDLTTHLRKGIGPMIANAKATVATSHWRDMANDYYLNQKMEKLGKADKLPAELEALLKKYKGLKAKAPQAISSGDQIKKLSSVYQYIYGTDAALNGVSTRHPFYDEMEATYAKYPLLSLVLSHGDKVQLDYFTTLI
jgi:hypothetical protein